MSGTTDALCCCNNGAWAACSTSSGGSGTVTSVAVAVPAEWSVSGSPVTTSGTITISEANQTANTVYAGPTIGSAAAPGFRALVDGDVPNTITVNLATAASDLTCSNCIGGTEIDESALAAVPTATALAANPADCTGADNEFAQSAAASGDLSCAAVVAEPLRPSTLNVWPAGASSYDDEFTSTTLDGSWTKTATSGNTTVSGSIGLINSPAAPVYDLTTVPGWLMWQSDSSGSGVAFTKAWTQDTTSMWFVRCSQDQRNYSASQEGSVHFGLTVAADSNESVFLWANTTGTTLQFRIQVQNNGSFTEAASTGLSEVQPLSPFILLLVRATNDYYGFVSYNEGAAYTYLGMVTKTGVTTFDEARLVFLGANETPSPIMGCDYIRYETDNTFPTFTR